MAKDKDKKEAAEGTVENIEVPEKPKKRGGSEIGLIPMVGVIGGTVLSMILVVFALYWFFIRPDIIGSHGGKQDSTQVEEKELTPAQEEELKMKQAMKKLEEEDAIGGEAEGVLFVQTSDIITNTNPPDWFIVIQLGLEYRLPTIEGEAAPAAEGHGGGGAAGPKLEPKLESEVRAIVTKFFGMRSIDEITGIRDSLEQKFHEELKPIFLKNKIFLRKVAVPKFVTQRA